MPDSLEHPVQTLPRYVQDILGQPQALRGLLTAGLGSAASTFLSHGIAGFDRILITGMGASLYASYPSYLRLAKAGLPVWLVETGELLHDVPELVTGRSLLWVASQSGESAEVQALLERCADPRPTVLGIVNNTDSALARAADVVIELHAGEETAVSTRTYVNTLAASALAVRLALGEPESTDLFDATGAMQHYLAHWRAHADAISDAISTPDALVILGRGASLAAASTGALIIKEAAKYHAEAMSTSQFRHGPLEMVAEGVTAVLLEGDRRTAPFSQRLADDIRRYGGRVVWLGQRVLDPDAIPLAAYRGAAQHIAEILPLQLLSVVLAERAGIEPGVFRHLEKVTRVL
ncbi:glucosamine--fructose-6-phosphate aminotransferase (isomerizing) [Kibdelosporangium banguiense]|uniref:Glutamine--fructose-6-phosphate aminotransferase [isomerizing] n=1 Tax=Kibdelosporangium banguiense TaxID=1365924 RepID=A0ABS4TGC8_9PSEU|nr:SIS domain-containing protein [Kibdelosporangium banguiense]MBP2323462.1 glucosamine--fructose-6-phosphate aminotransferase (isomerizing) [Kibdelosporangium banguiense]